MARLFVTLFHGLPEDALDCPAGSGAMLAFLPIRVTCESGPRVPNGVLPILPLPCDPADSLGLQW